MAIAKPIVVSLLEPAALAAVTMRLLVPTVALVGVPVIVPLLELNVSPPGNVPETKVKFVGLPVAGIAFEKTTPTVPEKFAAVRAGGRAGATGVPLTDVLAALAPTLLTALRVTGYVVPLLRPVIVSGLLVESGDRAM